MLTPMKDIVQSCLALIERNRHAASEEPTVVVPYEQFEIMYFAQIIKMFKERKCICGNTDIEKLIGRFSGEKFSGIQATCKICKKTRFIPIGELDL